MVRRHRGVSVHDDQPEDTLGGLSPVDAGRAQPLGEGEADSDSPWVDLDDTTGCPLGERCQRCDTTAGLAVYTADAPGGVVCLTLCPACEPPLLGVVRASVMMLAHCGHLGIDADQMATALHHPLGKREARS